MAKEHHLSILRQGKEAWNTWRGTHRDIFPDLSGANLIRVDLPGAYFSNEEILSRKALAKPVKPINFQNADLHSANIAYANLTSADFDGADLSDVNLAMASLANASFRRAILKGADLRATDLAGADLAEADLTEADLTEADLTEANFDNTNFNNAHIRGTRFTDVDLHNIKNIDTVQHHGPSYISTSTIERSEGNISENFLRGAGLSDTFIDYARSLAMHPIQYYTCFISYSSKDDSFSKRLHADLQQKGIRCWFAPKDLRWGSNIRKGIDEAIRVHEKLLLILSKNSLNSGWVEKEIKTAMKREKQEKTTILFPIRLDNAIQECPFSWATEIRRERNIGDFSHWKTPESYTKAFERLIHDLKRTQTYRK
jgi:hypothetical protein